MKFLWITIFLGLFSCNQQSNVSQKEIFPDQIAQKINALSKNYVKYITTQTNLTKNEYYKRNSIIVKVEIDTVFCQNCLIAKMYIGNKLDVSDLAPNYVKIYYTSKHTYAFLYYKNNDENSNYIKRALFDNNLIDKNTEDDNKRESYSLFEEHERWFSCISAKRKTETIKSPYIVERQYLKKMFCK